VTTAFAGLFAKCLAVRGKSSTTQPGNPSVERVRAVAERLGATVYRCRSVGGVENGPPVPKPPG
jgi:hypothetical protein